MTWTNTMASMQAWKTANNSSAGAVSLWWVQARALTTAYDAWHTKWTSDSLELTAGNAAFATAEQLTTGAQSAACNITVGTWVDNLAGQADKNACKTACQSVAVAALVANYDTATPTVDNGGASIAMSQ